MPGSVARSRRRTQTANSIGVLEVVSRLLALVLQEHVAVGDRASRRLGPEKVVDALHPLQVHRNPFEPVGDFAGDGPAFEPAHLLEIGELCHLHAVQPDLPAQPPGTEGRRLPVVLDETDVVNEWIDSELSQRFQIELLDRVGRGLHDDLELIVVLQPIRVLAIATVRRAPRRLHIGSVPRLRANRPQEGAGMKGACADLHVVRLEDHAALATPIALKLEDEVLKTDAIARQIAQRGLRRLLKPYSIAICTVSDHCKRRRPRADPPL
jgi:hypothetical protein